jgi:hypothetical protein
MGSVAGRQRPEVAGLCRLPPPRERPGHRAGHGTAVKAPCHARRQAADTEQARPRIRAPARLHCRNQTATEIQLQLRHLHLPSPVRQHADIRPPMPGGDIHPRPHRQARHQGRPHRTVEDPHPRTGRAPQCLVQALRCDHRSRPRQLDPRPAPPLHRPCHRLLRLQPHHVRRRLAGLGTRRQIHGLAGRAGLGHGRLHTGKKSASSSATTEKKPIACKGVCPLPKQ